MTAETARRRIYLAYTDHELRRFYGEQALARLAELGEVVRGDPARILTGAELAAAARGCDVVIAHRSVPADAEFFRAVDDQLLAFVRGAVDVSTVDIEAATERGIVVANATATFGRSVAEYGLALMIDLARGMSRARDAFRDGHGQNVEQGMELRGAVVAVVGMGVIGRELAALCHAIGMRVVYVDPVEAAGAQQYRRLPLADALAEADVVVCAAANIPSTRHMFDDEAFAGMKPRASFINLSRGELVDEDALVRALDAGGLRGAGMDVGSGPDQTPPLSLAQRPDVVATPHIAGMTAQSRGRQAMDTVHQTEQVLAGRIPDRAVNAADVATTARVTRG